MKINKTMHEPLLCLSKEEMDDIDILLGVLGLPSNSGSLNDIHEYGSFGENTMSDMDEDRIICTSSIKKVTYCSSREALVLEPITLNFMRTINVCS